MVDGVAPRRLPHPVTGQLFASPVPPGTGWPGDPSSVESPVASSEAEVSRLAGAVSDVTELSAAVAVCRACPRLVAWREQVAVDKRASFAAEPYWGRPIAGWGSAEPRVLIVGLAPAAHGGNRTGRIFTGDMSGTWLFGSLHRVGLAAQTASTSAGDGQELIGTRMLAAVRCAPPLNRPTTKERDTCAPWFDAELSMVWPSLRVIVCLGLFGWDCLWRALRRLDQPVPRPRPRFGHGARVAIPASAEASSAASSAAGAGAGAPVRREIVVLGCYHPSQQNTFTGTLTEPMIDAVLGEAAALAST